MKQKILLLLLQTFFALGINAEIFTGSCGANLTYVLDTSTGVLKIDGSGDMYNYKYGKEAPWYVQSIYIHTLNLSESITHIGDYAFWNCSGLASVAIPNSVTSIGDDAFLSCSGLTSVTIPNSVTSIGNSAFTGCSGLISVAIPNSVTSIKNNAFHGCSSLTSVTIPNSVTSIGDEVFSGCKSLTSITVPNSVTSIGEWAFSGCKSLTSITIPTSVTSIGNSAFQNCSGLISITIPNSVTSIGKQAFFSCSGLTSVTIPNSITSIGTSAFAECTGLISFIVDSSNNYYSSEDNVLFDKAKTALLFCIPAKQGSYIIPKSVTSIGELAFSSCEGLTSIVIPNSVSNIGNSAFSYCSGLTSVSIGSSVSSIGNFAFNECRGLTSIIIPNSVTNIGNSAFSYCSGLTSVIIPNSVTNIGNSAFYFCSGLTSVTIPNSVTSIGSEAFYHCSKLNVLNWNANISGSNLFYGASNVKEIIIGDDVTTVYPFGTNSSLNKVVLGKRVQYIRQNSFQNFRGDFYVYGTEAPYLYPDAFKNADLGRSTLYVPATKASYYQTTDPWSKFGNIKICPCTTPTISIVDGAFKFTSETEGAEFHYTITTESNTVTGEGDTATLDDVKFVVSVYATADGYETSETAVQTFSASELGGVSGDMNDDGELTISDVTSLVDKIIKK